jgi:hypothetical protein
VETDTDGKGNDTLLVETGIGGKFNTPVKINNNNNILLYSHVIYIKY